MTNLDRTMASKEIRTSPEGAKDISPGRKPWVVEAFAPASPEGAKDISPGRKPWVVETVAPASPEGAKDISPGRKPWVPASPEGAKDISPGRKPWVPASPEGAKEFLRAPRVLSPLRGSNGLLPSWIVLLLFLTFSSLAFAQPTGPITYKLTVTPAVPPTPALQYSLLPEMTDMSSGNALTKYYKAFSLDWWGFYHRQPVKWHEDFDKAQEAPLDQMPAEFNFVKGWRMLREVDEGARRDHCDWELIPVMKRDGIGTLLPDVQGMRNIARALALRARYELAEGDIEKAVYTLQTGFAMAKHIGEGPSLIHMLVGIAISQVMGQQLDELIRHPKCPNLYWSLSRLPRPFADIRRPIQAEYMMLSGLVPRFDELRKGPLPLDEAQEIMDLFLKNMQQLGLANIDRVTITGQALATYGKAKAALIAGGRKQAVVEQMPVPQVVLLHASEEFLRLRDDVYKWVALPFYDGFEGLKRAEAAYKSLREQGGMLTVFIEMLPTVQKVYLANVRADRRFAMMRAVEALRLHAAMHDGKFPKSLSEIKAVPVPLDPATGKAFEYTLQGDKASLYGPPPPGEQVSASTAMLYEVVLRR